MFLAIRYRQQVVRPVLESFASLEIEHKTVAVAKPLYTLADRRMLSGTPTIQNIYEVCLYGRYLYTVFWDAHSCDFQAKKTNKFKVQG